jgi:hypothetical protein
MKLLRLAASATVMLTLLGRLAAAPILPSSYTIHTGAGYADDTGGQLTDGNYAPLIPGVDLTPYEWVGWDGGTPSITFNFGSVVSINQVSLSMANWTAAAVYLPEDVVIGGTAFTVNPASYPNLNHALLTFNGAWTGSSLTIDLDSSHNRWIFIDEVTFNQGPGDVTSSVPDTASTLPAVAAALVAVVALRRRLAGVVRA